MKYKLIDSVSKIETLCEKVTIDGFDYYVISTAVGCKYGISKLNQVVEVKISYDATLYKGIICSTNPNIDVPKVINEAERLAKLHQKGNYDWQGEKRKSFIIGYNKSQETHPYSEDFFDWIDKEEIPRENGKWIKYFNGKDNYLTTKELLQLWKEQKPKIVYYG